MSVESEILRIQHNIADSYTKVAEKGGEVPLQPNSQSLAASIETIPSAGDLIAGNGLTKDGNTLNVDLPSKHLTQAEYNALTEEEKQADVVYIVDEPAWKSVPLSIQEYDTESGWHVRKWSDGYIELVRNLNWETTTFISWTIPYYKFAQKGELPFSLSEIYSLDFYIHDESTDEGSETGTIITTSRIKKNGDCVVLLYSLGARTRSYEVSEKITGRWK